MFGMIDILCLLSGFLELWHIIKLCNEKKSSQLNFGNLSATLTVKY